MIEETDNMADSSFQEPGPAAGDCSRVAYFGAAVLSGVTSVVVGSIVCVTFAYAFRGDAVGFTEYMIILLMWCMYSAAIVLPVSVIIAFPLMVVLRHKGQLTKFLLSVAAGALSAALCAAYIYYFMPGSAFKLVEALGIGITYGAVFGVVAAGLPRRRGYF